ncbi:MULTISPECIES: TIGR02391 family protein [Streptomyces]|uniref:TIGR02391 family protein n=1 Tax=Streptomyces malaysiensis subsp. samsunensis TaxID=459658 RepID=A0A9X2RV32_STRMQ|nr:MULTISPECIES: TIGR02391 family protein [Streptomyces]MCQ8829755.1 TIGR02391 family protein [Streptomyces samsunensis]QTI89015.1 TIGR02391 family protein [Streptomyces sp. AgN23]
MTRIADAEWAICQLDRFIELTTLRGVDRLFGIRERRRKDEILELYYIVEKIFSHVDPRWQSKRSIHLDRRWEPDREMAIQIRTRILKEEDTKEKLGDNSPRLSAGSLHPWVWDGARSLWQSGHFREAVTAAAKQVNAEAQNKLGRRDVSETALFNSAFSTDGPKPGQPRLRLAADDGSDTFRSIQRGARSFAEGCYAGIRNPNSHEVMLGDIPEHEALEHLAAFSILARWIDNSSVKFS